MKFLIVTKSREAPPMEMALPMLQMMQGWVAEHRGSGKLLDTWSFAGTVGGGGILEVDSHEELDAIMTGFPFGQTSDVTVYALADLDAALAGAMANIQAMMEGAG